MQAVRSVLFLPASNPRAIAKARGLACDVVILDLEDAVAPEAKQDARLAALQALRDGGFGPRAGVRINPPGTPWGEADIEALGHVSPDFIVVPKAEDAGELVRLGGRLPGGAALWAMIESPRALLELTAISGAARAGRLEALMLGVNDLALGLGCERPANREPLKPWLAATVAAARAYGLMALDGVFNAFADAEGFAAECRQARLYGFDGKSLIHPAQIDAANRIFSPSEEDAARARAIVAAFAAPEAQGRGAIQMEGQMIERLHLAAAERLLARLDPRR